MFTSTRHWHPETEPRAERRALEELAEEIRDQIEVHLLAKYAGGAAGWDKPEAVPDRLLVERLRANIEEGDWLDVACLAALLWNRHTEA